MRHIHFGKMKVHFAALLFCTSIVSALVQPRVALTPAITPSSSHWKRSARVPANETIRIDIALSLAGDSSEKAAQAIEKISDPNSPSFGQHWSSDKSPSSLHRPKKEFASSQNGSLALVCRGLSCVFRQTVPTSLLMLLSATLNLCWEPSSIGILPERSIRRLLKYTHYRITWQNMLTLCCLRLVVSRGILLLPPPACGSKMDLTPGQPVKLTASST